jgi:hypothetical protein
MKKTITTLYLICICSFYGTAQTVWLSSTNYGIGALVTVPVTATNADGSTTSNNYTFISMATPNTNNKVSNGNYWSVARTINALPLLDNYRYAVVGTLATYNGKTYYLDLINPNNSFGLQLNNSNPKFPNVISWSLSGWPRWVGNTGVSYALNSKTCELIDGVLYYFVCTRANSNQDPAISPAFWTVSDVIISPYSSKLHYTITGTSVTYPDANTTYSLLSEALPGQNPSTNPSLWQKWQNNITPPVLNSCFATINCNGITGDDKTTFGLSYQPSSTPVLITTGLSYYDATHVMSGTTTYVNLGEARKPYSPLILNGNDLMLRGSGDIYHGLGYYGSAGNQDATIPKKRNFADTPVDGPVLFGWAGGALGLRQRSDVGNLNSGSIEKIALRWDWANVYIGSPIVSGIKSLNHNLVVYGNSTFGSVTNPTTVTINGTLAGPANGTINLPAGGWIRQSDGAINLPSFVGIGGTNCPNGFKLAVKGGIIAESIEVQSFGNWRWSDYVFKKGYQLRSLQEVEQYIKTNYRLPEVPGENDVIIKGINVAEMDATLLKKIEELTLYIIDIQKQLNETTAEVARLKKRKN